MGGACDIHGEKRNAYSILMGKPEVDIPLRHLRVDEDNITMDFQESRWKYVDYIIT